ncbi:hypothetical protein KJ866_02880 [Patescibacteria group bacterium]|nr:hypothetical protein [Patescibacteria group bacterium]MBU2220277.1 hypothetical protein [Patescibacteria group bacterium]MBU2264637.1 hypothetical protein [Patescibacteria group bacterium]
MQPIKLIFLIVVFIFAVFYFYFWHVRINPQTGAWSVVFNFETQCQTLKTVVLSELKNANYCSTDFNCAMAPLHKNSLVCNALINKKEKLLSTKIKLFFFEQKKCPGYDNLKTCAELTKEEIICEDNVCQKME